MKKNYSLTIMAAVCCFVISSCSNSRYGSLSKVKAETKTAQTDKKKTTSDVVISTKTDNNSIELNSEQSKVVLNTETPKNEKTQSFESQRNIFSPKTNFIPKKNKAKRVENLIVESKKLASKESIKIPNKTEEVKATSKVNKMKKVLVDNALLIIFAILIPFVAVGLASDWQDTSAILISVLLTFLCWIPGIIHAIIYVGKHNKG